MSSHTQRTLEPELTRRDLLLTSTTVAGLALLPGGEVLRVNELLAETLLRCLQKLVV